jgi:hypothetical protein
LAIAGYTCQGAVESVRRGTFSWRPLLRLPWTRTDCCVSPLRVDSRRCFTARDHPPATTLFFSPGLLPLPCASPRTGESSTAGTSRDASARGPLAVCDFHVNVPAPTVCASIPITEPVSSVLARAARTRLTVIRDRYAAEHHSRPNTGRTRRRRAPFTLDGSCRTTRMKAILATVISSFAFATGAAPQPYPNKRFALWSLRRRRRRRRLVAHVVGAEPGQALGHGSPSRTRRGRRHRGPNASDIQSLCAPFHLGLQSARRRRVHMLYLRPKCTIEKSCRSLLTQHAFLANRYMIRGRARVAGCRSPSAHNGWRRESIRQSRIAHDASALPRLWSCQSGWREVLHRLRIAPDQAMLALQCL